MCVCVREHSRTGHAVCVSELFDGNESAESSEMCLRAAHFSTISRVCFYLVNAHALHSVYLSSVSSEKIKKK